MKRIINKHELMLSYYSDEELKGMMKMSVNSTLKWLEQARQFWAKTTPPRIKKLQEKLTKDEW